jgi:hypothetical protein
MGNGLAAAVAEERIRQVRVHERIPRQSAGMERRAGVGERWPPVGMSDAFA